MTNRWSVLALLFCVRVTMAFQFQAVAALSPFLMHSFGVGLADIGLLIGLYLSPGIVIALPGGAIGRRFGDKRAVAFGMVLMLAGGLVMSLAPGWEAQIAGRVLAGVGGCILNVLMTKMITDWFTGRELATAMGIFVNSWPVGIAGALLVLPSIAGMFGLSATMGLIAGFVAIGLALLTACYRPPAQSVAAAATRRSPLSGAALACVLLAGSIWGLYNGALGMIFGFGPAMLVERGWSASAASSTTSIVLWIVSVSVPLGGVIADRLRQRDSVLALGILSFAALMLATPGTNHVVLMFVALGVVSGIAAGPIMSLPADVLLPGNRALGMGMFYTLFYLAIFAAPIAAGRAAEVAGGAEAALSFGGWMLLGCLFLLGLFKTLVRQTGALVAAR
jgi:MFS family permease